MKTPDALIGYLLAKARAQLYSHLPPRAWHAQRTRVELALTLPAKYLEERKVEISAARYQAILDLVLDTIRHEGRRSLGPFPCAYLWACVERHLQHHGDDYYQEGKGVRNLLKLGMTAIERARQGADGTVPVFAQVHTTLAIGKRKPKPKSTTAATALQADLFAPARPAKIAKVRAQKPISPQK